MSASLLRLQPPDDFDYTLRASVDGISDARAAAYRAILAMQPGSSNLSRALGMTDAADTNRRFAHIVDSLQAWLSAIVRDQQAACARKLLRKFASPEQGALRLSGIQWIVPVARRVESRRAYVCEAQRVHQDAHQSRALLAIALSTSERRLRTHFYEDPESSAIVAESAAIMFEGTTFHGGPRHSIPLSTVRRSARRRGHQAIVDRVFLLFTGHGLDERRVAAVMAEQGIHTPIDTWIMLPELIDDTSLGQHEGCL